MKNKKLSVCEMWYQDVSEHFKELNEQAEHDGILIISRLMPIETYEEGRKHIDSYLRVLRRYFNEEI